MAGKLNNRPIDVLATMVSKTAEVCQMELDAGKLTRTGDDSTPD